ncbi:MAG: AAA family ATPase [Erysipelotrichaceae bacterium]|nr:AAA family ATPase [Erysipelotrichaceae bacterium]
MSITEIKILNILCFQRQYKKNRRLENDGISIKFNDGINVILGSTGTGKTSILKLLYASLYWSQEENRNCVRNLSSYFSSSIDNDDLLRNIYHRDQYSSYKVKSDKCEFVYSSLGERGVYSFKQWVGLNIPAIYIPSDEMLSNSKSFFNITSEDQIPYDATQNDIIINASFPEADNLSFKTLSILNKFDNILKSKVIFEDDEFFFETEGGRKVPFIFESTATKKFGLLSKLLRNGFLEPGSVLLWDEPENGIHPELFPFLADILLDLEDNDVQVFITTNSYSLAKQLELRRIHRDRVRYYNLYRGQVVVSSTDTEKKESVILCQSSYYFNKINNNQLIIAKNNLLDLIDLREGYY